MVIAASTIIGLVINFTYLDPIRALVYSAVINGIVAVPSIGVSILDPDASFHVCTDSPQLNLNSTLIMGSNNMPPNLRQNDGVIE